MKKRGLAWVISVDMGYGHQRAAYPLVDIAEDRIFTANNDKIISAKEQNTWRSAKNFYDSISRMSEIPLIGKFLFGIYDNFQKISPIFPFRDLSNPNFQVLYAERLLKKGLCKSLVEYMQNDIHKKDLPVIATHFIPALAAEYYGMKKVYCVITDTDMNRVWVAKNPKKSKIIYLAPSDHAAIRLKEYGVEEERIITTGFPLPKDLIGGTNKHILKRDLGRRILNLDPKKEFTKRFKYDVVRLIGKQYLRNQKNSSITITFFVGGAGAQYKTGISIVKSLIEHIKSKRIKINLVAGTNLFIYNYFNKELANIGLAPEIGKQVKVIFGFTKTDYFKEVSNILHTTDIIWTKPSELSFYAALGFPIIIAPPIGDHERFNKEWLEHHGSGFVQEKPEYTKDWLFYWIDSGRLAEAAFSGFIKARNMGTYEIEKVIKENKP